MFHNHISTIGNIIVLYILVFKFLERSREDKGVIVSLLYSFLLFVLLPLDYYMPRAHNRLLSTLKFKIAQIKVIVWILPLIPTSFLVPPLPTPFPSMACSFLDLPSIFYSCIELHWRGDHCCPMHCDLFKIYCAPPNLGITRTWICWLNFAQRPIFSGLRLFNGSEISDSGPSA